MLKYILIASLFIGTIYAQNVTPVVSNSRFEQRTDSSYKVDIYYDVNDADGDAMTVSILVSDDGGTTWDFTANNLTGDIGANITNGTNKQIVWYFGAEHPETFSDKFIIEISADDGITPGGGSPCPGLPTVTYAGKTYNTVQIGEQCWLKENLNVGTKINSTTFGYQQTNNGVIEKYCYNNDEANCDVYGGLYEWSEATQYETAEGAQGICPSGWHIPTYAEMQTLETYVGDQAVKIIDESQTMDGLTPTNETGFSALFAGRRYNNNGNSYNLGDGTYFWSSTEGGSSAFGMRLIYYASDVYFNDNYKDIGCSVRCLKD